MKLSVFHLIVTVAILSSCSTAYKTAQTPDDVYFSPIRPQDEYVRIEKKDDRYYQGSENYYEDRFIRMRMTDRYRWSALDDYYFHNSYAYNPYGNYYSWNNPWNTYWTWNTYYNPYCVSIPYYPGTVIIKNPKNYTPPSRAVAFNPNSYSVGNSSSFGRDIKSSYKNSEYNNNNKSRSTNNNVSPGGSVRKVITGGSTNNSNNSFNNTTPSRSYNPSSGSSSSSANRSESSSSGGSSGGGVSRPPR